MLQVFDADEEFLVGARGHVMVMLWRRLTYDRLRRAIAVHRWVLEDTDFKGTGFGVLGIVSPHRVITTDAMEDEMRKLEALMAPYIIANATVIEGQGVRSTMTRGAFSAARFTRSRSYPDKVFGDVSEAARWLVPLVVARTKDEVSAEDLAWDIAAAQANHLA